MTAVLVTGGAGYIGSHACKALAAAGYTPVAYDNLQQGHRWAVRWGPLEIGDLADRVRLDEVIARWQPVAVMHFAAFIAVGESVIDPGRYYRNNVGGSLALLEAVRDHGIGELIFSSTAAVYGAPQQALIDESHPQAPLNAYGRSKQMVEQMLADFGHAHGLRSISLRYFNASGADPAGETGEAHEPETHLIPLILEAAAGLRPRITVNGTDYDTPDGTCIRDYIHVSDLAQAHVLALEALRNGAGSTAYNLGNGRGFSVREVIECAGQVTGRAIPVEYGDRRPGDSAVLVADASRIRAELGWDPRHAGLPQIVNTAWRWLQHKPAGPNASETAP